MFKNYLKLAIRNLLKDKTYSFINIIGLAIGIATAFMILLYVYHEMTYDTFHRNAQHIYRITTSTTSGNGTMHTARTPNAMAPALRNDYPGIVNAVRVDVYEARLLLNGLPFKERLCYADPAIFDMFSFSLLRGNPATALQDRNAIVISEEIAQRCFGKEDPMGKTLCLDTGETVTVTGILREIPERSSIKFKILRPYAAGNYDDSLHGGEAFHRYNVRTYVQLSENFPPSELEKQFPRFVEKYLPAHQKSRNQFHLQKLTDIHLHSHLLDELEPGSNVTYSYILLGIAAFILFIACVNFMNLSTARFARRAKEIGMRKVLGAARAQLVKQFLGEAILLCSIAMVFGLALAEIVRPIFNDLVGKELELFPAGSPLPALFSFLALALAMGILSGVYPAFFQSSFPTLELLKENVRPARSNLTLRRLLVVLQFSLSIILIIGVGILFQQLDFMRDYDLGFEQEHVVVVPIDLFGHKEPKQASGIAGAIRDELSQCTGVISVSLCEEIPGHDAPRLLGFDWKGKDYLPIKQFSVDENYFATLGMEFVEGRNFSEEFGADVSGDAVILNEAAAKVMGWQSAIGKEMKFLRSEDRVKVIGVVKDYHFQSLHYAIEPLVFFFRTKSSPYHRYLAVRINPRDIPSTLDRLKKKWRAVVPNRPFDYFFLDDEFNRNYQTEELWSKIITCAALLTVFIACLGVFGLTAHTVTQRTKEIGIRKVLGATVANILSLLSQDFVKLVLLANLIALPIAYFAMNRWLQNFAYRIEISWWVFVLAGGLALLIALLTVSTQALKAALANPVESLRYE